MSKKGRSATYLLIVGCILLTKLLGMLRNSFLSNAYGTGYEAEVFQAVSKLPLTLYDVTLGTAIVSAFIPVFNDLFQNQGKKTAERFAGNFLTLAASFSALICLLGICFPSLFVNLVASGFEGDRHILAVELTRIILPVILFATVTYIFIGVLQSYGEFTAPSLVSLFTNLTILIYFLFFNSRFGIKGLTVAFSFGWGLQFLFLLPFVIKKKFRFYPSLRLSQEMRRVLILTMPLFIASLAQPINTLISTNLSSSMEQGALSILNYAYDAYFILAAVFASALTNMYFPELSRRFSAGDKEGATAIGTQMLKTVSAIVLPITAFMMTCGVPIIRIIYQRGEFTPSDTLAVAGTLVIYAVGMLALSFQEILNKLYYSMQKPWYPMLAAMGGIGLNLLLSLWFVKSFDNYRLLAWSTVFSGWFMVLILFAVSLRKIKGMLCRSLWVSLAKTLIASVLMGGASYGVRVLLDGQGLIRSALCVAAALTVGVAVYVAALWLLKSEELREILSLRKKKGAKE